MDRQELETRVDGIVSDYRNNPNMFFMMNLTKEKVVDLTRRTDELALEMDEDNVRDLQDLSNRRTFSYLAKSILGICAATAAGYLAGLGVEEPKSVSDILGILGGSTAFTIAFAGGHRIRDYQNITSVLRNSFYSTREQEVSSS